MIAAYLLIGLTVIVLISFYSCLDHIFVPRINKRLDNLEKQINEIAQKENNLKEIENENQKGKD